MSSRATLMPAVRAMRRGELIVYPTEGVLGLGCDAFDADAVAALLAAKRRSASKGFILLLPDVAAARPLLAALPRSTTRRVVASWPGPYTWLLPAPGWWPRWLRGGTGRVAVRISAHPLAAALCSAFGGPITSTSANLSGTAPLASGAVARRVFGARLGAVVPGAVPRDGAPSMIIDASTGAVIRAAPGLPVP